MSGDVHPTTAAIVGALGRVTSGLASAEDRPGQQQMAAEIQRALADPHHLVVAAGTGTGKTLAYLIPAILHGRRTVVATATKALQDQLATKDLPFIAEHLDTPFTWAVLKGRSNYVCLQRIREITDTGQRKLDLGELAGADQREVQRITEWAATSSTGELADLPFAPRPSAWRAVSVGADECPGKSHCPLGASCFAERARTEADTAAVVVVNTSLYGYDIASDGAILGEHEVVVFDEAHQLEDIISDTAAVEISVGRIARVAGTARRILAEPALITALTDAAATLSATLAPHHGSRLAWPLPDELQTLLIGLRGRVDAVVAAIRRIQEVTADGTDARQRAVRAQQSAGWLMGAIDLALDHRDGFVPYVGGTSQAPRLEIAPLDVGPTLRKGVWAKRTAILTSATIPSSIRARLDLADAHEVDVGSPFDFARLGLLYCAMQLPDPRSAGYAAATHTELVQLIRAAGGRTLALFTSWAAMDAAAAAVRQRVDVPIITQREMPKSTLLRAFAEDEATCLFATAGFFQGVDIPGRTLSLVTIDRIPFPRPNDPLLSARREQIGSRAFAEIDVPRAAMLLAQAAGRLIRTADDRGVVAVLDPRLGTARYRWDIVGALPPLRRTRDRAEAIEFLRSIATGADDGR